jgi:hypothetical protein
MTRLPKAEPKRANEAEEEDEAVIMERMKIGLKRLLNTPPETHKEMIERRRRQGAPKRRPGRNTT